MPPTYNPQAGLNTAPRRVLFHDRHFVADRRLALPDAQGFRGRVFVTKSGSQDRRRHLTLDAGLSLGSSRLYLRLRSYACAFSFVGATPSRTRRHSTTDLKRVKSDRTTSPTFCSSTSSLFKALRRHQRTYVNILKDLSRLFYSVCKARRFVFFLFDPQDALSTSRHAFYHAIYFRHQDEPQTLTEPCFASIPARPALDLRTTRSLAALRRPLESVSLCPSTSRSKIECKTQHACLKRLVCLKIPWDRYIAGGRCTGARPQRGPRVNPSALSRGPTGVRERRSERERDA